MGSATKLSMQQIYDPLLVAGAFHENEPNPKWSPYSDIVSLRLAWI
jgi:hypothetical protein